MLSQHIALVPEAGGVNSSDLARVCAALQKQLTRDLAPIWGIAATVNGFPHLEDVPLGHWPIIITFCELGEQAGVQIDRNGQPYAEVEMSPDWSLHASQACLDMLVNPYGSRLSAGPSPRPDQGPVEFLIEPCAPCAGPDYAYVIDDVLVSDFCKPAYWGSMVSQERFFSFTGAVRAPQQVLSGGHLTWHDPITDKWWLRDHVAEALVDTRLGSIDGRLAALRETMLTRAPRSLRAPRLSIEAFEARLGIRRHHALQASQFQAHRTRTLVANSTPSLGRDLDSPSSDNGSKLRKRRNQESIALLNGATFFPDESPANVDSTRGSGDDSVAEVTQRELIETAAPGRTQPPPLPEQVHIAEQPRASDQARPSELARASDQTRRDAAGPAIPPQALAAAASMASRVTTQPFPASFVIPATPVPSTMPPPTAVSYPPATVPPAPPRVNGWLFGATVAACGATLVLAVALYGRAARTPESTQSGAAASPTNVAQAPIPITAPTLPAAPAKPASSVAVTAPSQPEPAVSTLPEVARPAVSASSNPVPSPAARSQRRTARPEPSPSSAKRPAQGEEPASDSLDSLIVERR